MGARMRIGKWGRSLAVRIPKAIARRWGVSEGSGIEMTLRGDQVILCKPAYKLTDLLAGVTAENLHPEQDIGDSRGSEQW